jgi:hypothetical protein
MAFGKKTYTFNAQIRKIVIKTFAQQFKEVKTFGRSRYLRFRLPGQIKVAHFIIIHLEQHQASDLNRYSFQKIKRTLHFNGKAVQTGAYQAEVGAGSGAETLLNAEPELEPKRIISAPQHWCSHNEHTELHDVHYNSM